MNSQGLLTLKISWRLPLLSALLLAPAVQADTLTWNFASDPQFVAEGTAYQASGGIGTINVYAKQVSGGVLQSTPNSSLCGTTGQNANFGSNTCLFSTNASVYTAYESGIGPFDPTNNTADDINNSGYAGLYNDFLDQQGITPTNILELVLGSNIPDGTVLTFLLQGPTRQANNDLTSVNVFTGNSSIPVNVSDLTPLSGSPFGAGVFAPQGTTPEFEVTKMFTNEVVAIEADCEYILLTQVTGDSPVPEPRFYGLVMAGLLVLAGAYMRNRRTSAVKRALS